MKYKIRKFQNPSGTLQYFANLNAEAQRKYNSSEERVQRALGMQGDQQRHDTPGLRADRNGIVSVDYENQGDYVPTTAHKVGTAIGDVGTQLLHGVQTLGSSVVGDVVKGFSPKAANWLDKNTFGVITYTPEEKLNRNRQGNWNSRIADTANSVSTAVGFGSLGGVGRAAMGTRAGQGLLGSKLGQTVTRQGTRFTPKNTNFLINQDGFQMPKIGKIADAAQPSPLMDRVGMAELEAKRQLSRGKRKVQGAVERVKRPVRDYKDLKKAFEFTKDTYSPNSKIIIEDAKRQGRKEIDLQRLHYDTVDKLTNKYRTAREDFTNSLDRLRWEEYMRSDPGMDDTTMPPTFWGRLFPKETAAANTEWLKAPITKENFLKYANKKEMQNLAPYMNFVEFTGSPNNKFVGDQWGYSTFRNFDWALRNNKITPPTALRENYGKWANNLNQGLSAASKKDIKVGGSSLNFIKGHTKTLPGDIDRYVLGKDPTEKFVQWTSPDGIVYKMGNINYSGNPSQPGIAQVHMAYQDPKLLHSLNLKNAERAIAGKKIDPHFPVSSDKINMDRSTLTDLFLSSKDKHIDRLHEVAANVSEAELSAAFNTKLSGMSSIDVKFPKFNVSNRKENVKFLRKVAPELKNAELEALSNNEAKMEVLLKNYYLDSSVGTRYLNNYEHKIPKNLPLEERLKRITHSTDGSGGQMYRGGRAAPDVYYAKGNSSVGYGFGDTSLNVTTKANLNLPQNPSPTQLLENSRNFADGVLLHNSDIMTFPYNAELGYGVGQPLSYAAGSANAFPPRNLGERSWRTVTRNPRGIETNTASVNRSKRIAKVKASMDKKYPTGIPEDKKDIYNVLSNYSQSLKYNKLGKETLQKWRDDFPNLVNKHRFSNSRNIFEDWHRGVYKGMHKISSFKTEAKTAGIGILGGGALTGGVLGAVKGINYLNRPSEEQMQNNIKTIRENLKTAELSFEKATTREDREKALEKIIRMSKSLDKANNRLNK